MRSQGLTPNLTKTQLLPITRSRRALPINISLNGHQISPCKSVKYLGVTISSNLTWSEHIASTCKKAKRHLGLLHRSLYRSPPLIRKQIYQSAILPKLEYCSSVWDPHHRSEIEALEGVQKFASKVVTRQWKVDSTSLRKSLNWPTLSQRRKIQKLKICYNILNNLSIIPPTSFIPHPHPSPRHPHTKTLFTPFVSTSAHKFSFFIDVIHHWNSLPLHVVNSPSPSSFKHNLTKHLIQQT